MEAYSGKVAWVCIIHWQQWRRGLGQPHTQYEADSAEGIISLLCKLPRIHIQLSNPDTSSTLLPRKQHQLTRDFLDYPLGTSYTT